MKVKTLNGNLNIVGKNLKKYRLQQKLSQPDICKKLELIGVTMYNCDIYEIEYGKKTVKDFEALAFCKVLQITLEQLYSDTDKYYEAYFFYFKIKNFQYIFLTFANNIINKILKKILLD